MKLLKTLIAFLLLISIQISSAQWLNVPPPVEARTLMVIQGGGAVSGASCQVSPFLIQTDTNDDIPIGTDTSRYYTGTTYVPGANKCVCKIKFYLTYASGDISGLTYRARIWTITDTDLEPLNTEVTNSPSAGVTGSNSWSGTEVEFSFASCVQLTSGNTYGITLDHGVPDGTNIATHLAQTSSSDYTGGNKRWATDKSRTDNYETAESKINVYAYE